MTKDEQRAAAERIMKKHPLTADERQRYEMARRTPEEYQPPKDVRICGVCGAEFRDTVMRGEIQVPALAKFADHQTEHNSSAAEWAEAHQKIQASRQSSTRVGM